MAFSKYGRQFGDDATSSVTNNRELVEAVFQYLSEKKYPSGSDDTFKKKAAMFVIREGVMYF